MEIKKLRRISLSPLADNFFCLHVIDEWDYLLVSGRKVEIVTVILNLYSALTGQRLDVHFADRSVCTHTHTHKGVRGQSMHAKWSTHT